MRRRGLYRTLLAETILFCVGAFFFVESLCLGWIESKVTIEIDSVHIHHWIWGLLLMIIAFISFELTIRTLTRRRR